MLQKSVDWFVSVLGLQGRLAESVNFFIYDTIKILLLLYILIAVIGFLRTFLSRKKLKQILLKSKYTSGNLGAALFGAITPFCSCSSIPIFLGFIEAGIPLGISFSFLITSPLVNEYLVILMLGFFGWKITILYVIFGILVGYLGGIILGKLGYEHLLEKKMINTKEPVIKYDAKKRIKFGIDEANSIFKKIWLWVIAGVGVGALIHNFVPEVFIQSVVGKAGLLAVPLAVILGVPLYANCAAIVPVAVVLFEKGVPLGTALAFMMATAALSLPEAIMLRSAMKLKLIAIFFGTVTISIIIIGYLFNLV
jgi:uncharacterized protein